MEDHLLSEDERGFFQRFESLFESAEWQLLVNEWRKEIEEIPLRAFHNAQSWEEILAARALVKKLEEYLSYPAELGIRKQGTIFEREQQLADELEASRPDV